MRNNNLYIKTFVSKFEIPDLIILLTTKYIDTKELIKLLEDH